MKRRTLSGKSIRLKHRWTQKTRFQRVMEITERYALPAIVDRFAGNSSLIRRLWETGTRQRMNEACPILSSSPGTPTPS